MIGSASMAISDLVSTIACHVIRPILMLLPMEDDLPLSPDQRSHPLQLERELMLDCLAVSWKHKCFLRELQYSSLSHGGTKPVILITQPGIGGIGGVLNGI